MEQETKTDSIKTKRLKESISDAEKAVGRYSKGILTPLEMAIGCDVNVLLANWIKTRDERKSKLNKLP